MRKITNLTAQKMITDTLRREVWTQAVIFNEAGCLQDVVSECVTNLNELKSMLIQRNPSCYKSTADGKKCNLKKVKFVV